MKFTFLRSKKNSPATAKHLERGAKGEDDAVRALKKAHYKIVERNFRTPAGEIDIVARHRKCLVFVEVRTRSSTEFGLPQETIQAKKRKRLATAALWYLQKNRMDDALCRFDVVAVLKEDENAKSQIEIIRDAFRPEQR